MENEESLEIQRNPNSPEGIAQRWQKEIAAADKEQLKFHEDSERIIKAYLDKRDTLQEGESRVNMFWSTIETMKSSLYVRPPQASVARNYVDPTDDVARVASMMLERVLNSDSEADGSDFDSASRAGIEDWLIVGMGQMWMRYEVETEKQEVPAVTDPMTGMEISPATSAEVISEEKVATDYVYWKDFFWSPARTWSEVRWVARRVWLTKSQAKRRFGDVIAEQLNFGKTKLKKGGADSTPQNDPWGKAEIFEIWCREEKKAYWYSKGVDVILDVKDDPLQLEDFWPCPKPIMMNATTSNFMPRALYIFAQDQFEELNNLNTRIHYLTKAAKVAGVYDKTAEGVQKLFTQSVENKLIPVENWAMFTERGGVKGAIEFIPIEQIAATIDRLQAYMQVKVQQIYETLGISDIMRGSSKASETATAQKIKAQFGSVRLDYYQNELARWVRDALRIKAEVIAQHFQPETIIAMSNIQYTPDAPLANDAAQLIKTLSKTQYRIKVDSDTMAAIDWDARKQEATDTLSAMANFFAQTQGIIQTVPNSLPVVLQLMQAMVGKVKGADQVEGILDNAIEQYKQSQANPPPPPQPTPDQIAELDNKHADTEEKKAKTEKLLSDVNLQNLQAVHMALNPPPTPGMQPPGPPMAPPQQPPMAPPGPPMGMPQ